MADEHGIDWLRVDLERLAADFARIFPEPEPANSESGVSLRALLEHRRDRE